jgi:proteasome lid subunit RPN8/RPN11
LVSDSLYLTQSVYDEIIAHARAGKPREVCGILRGRGDRAFQALRARNVAPDPVRDYEVDPQTVLRQFDFEEAGDAMVAIYHSHPASPAYPSASDAWNAHYPDCAYLICSLEDEAPVVRAFGLTAHDTPVDTARLQAELEWDETRPGRFAYYQSADAPVPPVLDSIVAQVPLPFYVVFESPERAAKNSPFRVVSIVEYPIQIVPG